MMNIYIFSTNLRINNYNNILKIGESYNITKRMKSFELENKCKCSVIYRKDGFPPLTDKIIIDELKTKHNILTIKDSNPDIISKVNGFTELYSGYNENKIITLVNSILNNINKPDMLSKPLFARNITTIQYCLYKAPSNSFIKSIYDGYIKYKTLTDKQWIYVEELFHKL